MKSHLLFTASGPLLILTSHESLRDPNLLEKLKHKGIGKFAAFEVPVSLARERYGGRFLAVEGSHVPRNMGPDLGEIWDSSRGCRKSSQQR